MTHPEARGLGCFQDRFARALAANESEPARGGDIARLVAQPGFSVYRNTVMKACIDALQANYPAVSRYVGDEWFRAASAIFARSNLPRQPMLVEYGDGFAAFLADFSPAAELPHLADLARLDRAWTESHVARNEAALEPAAIAALDAEALGRTVLTPHVSSRWAAFDGPTVRSTWRRNRFPDAPPEGPAPDAHGAGLLFVRPYDSVRTLDIDNAGCAFLDACLQGHPLATAAAAALEADACSDLSRLMACLLSAGAFGGLVQP